MEPRIHQIGNVIEQLDRDGSGSFELMELPGLIFLVSRCSDGDTGNEHVFSSPEYHHRTGCWYHSETQSGHVFWQVLT